MVETVTTGGTEFSIASAGNSEETSKEQNKTIQVLPVTPWGNFVPALNAIVLHAKNKCNADLLMFVSAEVDASAETISTLCRHVLGGRAGRAGDGLECAGTSSNVIVAGAALSGHDYQGEIRHEQMQLAAGASVPVRVQQPTIVPLNGRTAPWNTLSVWDLSKLSMVGFACISDIGKNAGIEECVAIAILQKLYPGSTACLVKVDDTRWDAESFQDDEERKKWHEQKMKSKLDRAAWQLEQLNLSGTVIHL